MQARHWLLLGGLATGAAALAYRFYLARTKGKKKPNKVVVSITGFSSFQNVASNPTEVCAKEFPAFCRKNRLPDNVTFDRCQVLEVSGEGSKEALENMRNTSFVLQGQCRVWLHFGVNTAGKCFHLERVAWNEAHFRCPDVLGWQPQNETIFAEDGKPTTSLKSALPIDALCRRLRGEGFKVQASTDPGRYVCNWVYYHSLRDGQGTSNDLTPQYSLFVHVPSFEQVDKEMQLKFWRALLCQLGKALCE